MSRLLNAAEPGGVVGEVGKLFCPLPKRGKNFGSSACIGENGVICTVTALGPPSFSWL